MYTGNSREHALRMQDKAARARILYIQASNALSRKREREDGDYLDDNSTVRNIDDPITLGLGGQQVWNDELGRLHRDGAPAVVDDRGLQMWYNHGKLHRDGDMPAITWSDHEGFEWWNDGKRHRDGKEPAVIRHGYSRYGKLDTSQWWKHGERVTEEQAEEIAQQERDTRNALKSRKVDAMLVAREGLGRGVAKDVGRIIASHVTGGRRRSRSYEKRTMRRKTGKHRKSPVRRRTIRKRTKRSTRKGRRRTHKRTRK